MEYNLPIPMNSKDCLINIIKLEETVRTHGNKQLQTYASLGESITKLKIFDPENYINLLKNNNITYDISYLNFFICFSDLCSKYPKLLQCSISIHFMKTNFKHIKEICNLCFI